MATMTSKAARMAALGSRIERAFAAIQRMTSSHDLGLTVAKWVRAAEALRKRWENECSYEWADTEQYRKATERAEKRLVASVRETGLHAYLQTDPRGAALYVDSQPITDQNYTNAICVCID